MFLLPEVLRAKDRLAGGLVDPEETMRTTGFTAGQRNGGSDAGKGVVGHCLQGKPSPVRRPWNRDAARQGRLALPIPHRPVRAERIGCSRGRRPRRFVLRLLRAGLDAAGYNNTDGEVNRQRRREPVLLCGSTLAEDQSLLRSLRTMRSLRLANPGVGG